MSCSLVMVNNVPLMVYCVRNLFNINIL